MSNTNIITYLSGWTQPHFYTPHKHIGDVVEDIRSCPVIARYTNTLRNNHIGSDGSKLDTYKAAKSQIKTVNAVWTGEWPDRKDTTTVPTSYSNLLFHETDDTDPSSFAAMLEALKNDENTTVVYKSLSGSGCHVITPVSPPITSKQDYDAAWAQRAAQFSQATGINMKSDTQARDYKRIAFLSHDPDVYYNSSAAPFIWTQTEVVNSEVVKAEELHDHVVSDTHHLTLSNILYSAMGKELNLKSATYTSHNNIKFPALQGSCPVHGGQSATAFLLVRYPDKIVPICTYDLCAATNTLIEVINEKYSIDLSYKISKKEETAQPINLAERLLTAEQVQEMPDPEWLISNFLPKNQIVLIASDPKAGKSTLVGAMLAEVSKTNSFAGNSANEKLNALWLTEEGGSTFKALANRVGLKDNYTLMPRGQVLDILWDNLVDNVIEYVNTNNINLIIVDTLGVWVGCEDLNSYAKVTEAFAGPLKLRDQTNATVLLIHHSNKQGATFSAKVNGSQAILAHPDMAVLLEAPDAASRARTLEFRGRTMPQYNENTMMLNCDDNFHYSQTTVITELALFLENEVRQAYPEGLSVKDLANILDEEGRSVPVNKTIREHLEKNDNIVKERAEKKGKGRPGYIYKYNPKENQVGEISGEVEVN